MWCTTANGSAITACPIAQSLLAGATCERHLEWKLQGRAMSSRPDAFTPGRMLFDLKTTTDASPIGFGRQAWRMAYHAQSALYIDALASLGIDVLDAYLVAVETKPPYPVTVMRLTAQMIDVGRRTYRTWFETLRVCEESDHWPAYTSSVVPWDVPAWIEHDEDDEQPDDPEDAEVAA